jgi:hypothetical protein
MPWRKKYDPLSSVEQKGQRAYEVRREREVVTDETDGF